ncbi:acylneuraminate cytidylyltransferase family protein [Allofournierella sp.]|uniref:acylneuraminate cytidylyltransferase family protein n=1 Tax=Allofournierella sp. TaxID=1940256 RepID=UPI003AB4FAAC
MERLLITICGRAGSKGFKNKNLKTFCGRPLVYYSLAAAQLFLEKMPGVQADICLNTDSEALAALVAEKYPEVAYLPREAALGGDTAPKMAVIQDSLARMEARQGCAYDYVMDLDITSPLRTAQDIRNAYELKSVRPDLDLVYSVTESRRNPYFNMVRDCGDHIEKGIENRPEDGTGSGSYTARQQAPVFYDVNASIYVYRRGFLAENTTGIIWDAKTYVVTMMDTGILDIDSEEDFKLMEVIAGHLYATLPEFAAVRRAVRA